MKVSFDKLKVPSDVAYAHSLDIALDVRSYRWFEAI